MPELLLEVGCEELPASFIEKASLDLQQRVLDALKVAFGRDFAATSSRYSTPRRLIVSVLDVPAAVPASVAELRGPSEKAAFGPDGAPAGPLIGFCKGAQVDVGEAFKRDGYVWINKTVPEKPTSLILSEAVPTAITGLTFEKSMRWGSSRLRFARPIRWILCAFDGAVVEFKIEDVASGLVSRGHRFYGPEDFEARTLAELLSGLRSRKVEPDPNLRKESIIKQVVALGGPQLDSLDPLVDENANLAEWPTAISGQFKEAFLRLPPQVLVTAMAKHEKMFSVYSGDKLTNQFIFVRNSGQDDDVRKGAEWVLNARLDDARFFFDEDKKFSLAHFLEKCGTIVFHAKLGSVRDRCERLHDLCGYVARETPGGPNEDHEAEIDFGARAGLFAKADLSTGLVSELPSLQGIVGSEYARSEEFADPVAYAIAVQYTPSKAFGHDCEGGRTAIRLAVSDSADRLAGFLGLGMAPTGSSDPNALRRAATHLVECAWNWPRKFPSLLGIFGYALDMYIHQDIPVDPSSAIKHFGDLLRNRYEVMMSDYRYDVVESILHLNEFDPQWVRARAMAVTKLSADKPFLQAASRPIQLYRSAIAKHIAPHPIDFHKIEPSELQSESGAALLKVGLDVHDELYKLLVETSTSPGDKEADDVAKMLRSLVDPINRFFDDTMILTEDEAVRSARLHLVHLCHSCFTHIGDFTKVVQPQ